MIRTNLNYISKVLFKVFKKINRFNLNSNNLYLLILYVLLFNFNRRDYFLKKYKNIEKNEKYYYLVFFSLLKISLINHSILEKIENKININSITNYLDQKNKITFIYLENFSPQGNYLNNFTNDFFFKLKKKIIYLEESYKFRIDIFSFLFYGKYIEYLRKSIYNEYLAFTPALWNYPLLKTFFRLITYVRLDKLKNNDKSFLSKKAILKKYHIYDDFDSLRIFKLEGFINNYKFSNYLVNSFLNTNFYKSLIIWKNKKFYNYIDHIFNKFLKSSVVLSAYEINLNYEDEEDVTDTNKLNMMGLYSLYWQMNRYGFNYNYYYYLHSLISNLFFHKENNLTSYNIYYLKFILSSNKTNYWIFWYKLMRLVLLDFIYSSFFKFFKYNRLYLKKKKLRFKRLLSLRFLIETYNFIFLPLNMEFYDNNQLLVKNLNLNKIFLDTIVIHIFFGYNINFSNNLNLDLNNISKKINLDQILFSNLDFYLNLLFFYLNKKIGKYFFINYLTQYKELNFFLVKIFYSQDYFNNYLFQDILQCKSLKFLDFYFSRHTAINYFYSYRNRFLNEYLWDFEFIMIYSFYLIVLYRYNQLYLKIFIGKFLLFGI